MFKRAAVFTDLHYGKKNNSRLYNEDCKKFVEWFIDEAKAFNADTIIFCGDFFDNRRFINIVTLNYALESLKLLNDSFNNVYMILGNHDIYLKEKRTVNSVEVARSLTNIHVVDNLIVKDGVALVPWLIGDEHKKLSEIDCKYMFGHFELPSFILNAMIEMPDHGGLNAKDLTKPDYVFSGHFHKRQNKGNVWYIGNAFPQNFADVHDVERGMMFLEWDKKPIFKAWPEQPVYITYPLSVLVENPEKYLNEYTSVKAIADIELSYEEAQVIKESFSEVYKCREFSIIDNRKEDDLDNQNLNVQFKTVDEIVIEGLEGLENKGSIDNKMLVDIYNNLEIDSK